MFRTTLSLAFALTLALGVACAQDKKDEKQDTKDAKAKTVAFDAPATWKVAPRKSNMTQLAYTLDAAEGDSEGAAVTLYYFNGAGGSFDENVKRWCGQFKDAEGDAIPVDKAKVEKLEVGAIKIRTLEVSGTFAPAPMGGGKAEPKTGFRLIAAYIEGPSGPWFARFVGPEKSVEKHRDAFMKWLKSVRSVDAAAKEDKKDDKKDDKKEDKKDQPKEEKK